MFSPIISKGPAEKALIGLGRVPPRAPPSRIPHHLVGPDRQQGGANLSPFSAGYRARTEPFCCRASLSEAGPQIRRAVVGWGKDEAEFRQLAKRLGLEGALVFTGYAPEGDLAGRYSLSDVYIGAGSGGVAGTGRRGGHAHRLAHSGGQPGALPELVQNGVNGYLFESMVEDLADKMPLMLALRDRWEDMGQSSLDQVRVHDMPAVLAQIEELYGKLASVLRRGLAGNR